MRVSNPITSLSQIPARDHHLLAGLADDDHSQYLKADGTRALTGNLSASAGVTIDGRDVSSLKETPSAYKTADEQVTNSTTMQNDDHLALSVGANDILAVFLFLLINSPSAPAFKYQFTVPSGATIYGQRGEDIAGMTGSTYPIQINLAAARTVNTNGQEQLILAWAKYVGGGTAGTLQLQWAQNVADANPTTVRANSYLLAFKLS